MATSYDLNIFQGEDYNLSLNLTNDDATPLNLSGYSISGYIKTSYGATGYLVSLNSTIVSEVSGIIALSIPAYQTINLPITIAQYAVEISNGFTSTIVLRGNSYISPSIFSSNTGYVNGVITNNNQNYDFTYVLTSGIDSEWVNYPNVLSSVPSTVNCFLENNIDNYNYLFNASNISSSGFNINFSDTLKSTGYILSVILGM